MKNIVVLIPIYKTNLDAFEQYSLDSSILALNSRTIYFIGPKNMNVDYYITRYPSITYIALDPSFFASIKSYNRLLLDVDFYQKFSDYELMLILQTDAIVLRDDLDYWGAQPFDYVGAPWPDGIELFVNLGRFEGDKGRRVRAMVGNGGFSLRRIKKCVLLLQEFPEAIKFFLNSGSSEDLFFSFLGPLSSDFVLPNEITSSLFSLELKPSFYYSINGHRLPMGGHAWWKYDINFWKTALPPSAELEALCASHAVTLAIKAP